MKGGDYMDQQHHRRRPKHEQLHHHSIFSKLQPSPPPHPHQPIPFSPHHHDHPFHLSGDNNNHDESADQPQASSLPLTALKSGSGDGASIEVVRRPRGRPPGSKNKPKPPVIITREPNEPVMSPYILEVPGGSDVVEALSRFCRRKLVGICVLTGSGTVSNVTLRQPSIAPAGSTVTFHGRFDILSLSAAFFPPLSPPTEFQIPNSFTISLGGPQGQVVGGIVSGALLASGTVYVIAATFTNPIYHRLAAGEGEKRGRGNNSSANDNNNYNSGSAGSGGEGQSPGVSVSVSRGESGGELQQQQQQQGGMYGGHMAGGSDVIWLPTARPPPPY